MADTSKEKSETAPTVADTEHASGPEAKSDDKGAGMKETPKTADSEVATGEADAPEETSAPDKSPVATDKEAADEVATEAAPDKPAAKEEEKETADNDVEMKDASDTAEKAAPEADTSAPEAQPPASKGKAPRRKSGGGDTKSKTLNKKGFKARLSHKDAQPGDHFLVKLKGFPAWPAIICDESMLPAALINSRPVSAARPDGSWSEHYVDGGKRAHDRSFPVMYLHTNEFGWVQNTALSELSPDKAKDSIPEKSRKDLRAAYELAAERNPVDHYKEILKSFQEEQIAQEEARKQAAATPKKAKKGKGKAVVDDDGDVEMADDADGGSKSAKAKKRKAEEDTPRRADSVKKPKIKLNTSSSTPKTANGAATPKSAGGSSAKASKKSKRSKDGGDKTAETSKEANMTPEERRARKEKEVLYLRHKLQRGLLTREQQPREDEMKAMSEYITLLENLVDLEASIIRTTKINKVLKAILKLESIPREDEFEFKKRSSSLLDRWNKLLAGDATATPAGATNGANGTGGEKKSEANGVEKESKEKEPDKTVEPANTTDTDKATDAKTEEVKGDEEATPKSASAVEAADEEAEKTDATEKMAASEAVVAEA